MHYKLGAVALCQGLAAMTQRQSRYLDMIYLSHNNC